MYRVNFFTAVVNTMASLTMRGWNAYRRELFYAYHFVDLLFLSVVTEPKLLVKHIMWALNEVFDSFVKNEQYGSVEIMVELGDATIGWGKVYDAVVNPSAPVPPSPPPT